MIYNKCIEYYNKKITNTILIKYTNIFLNFITIALLFLNNTNKGIVEYSKKYGIVDMEMKDDSFYQFILVGFKIIMDIVCETVQNPQLDSIKLETITKGKINKLNNYIRDYKEKNIPAIFDKDKLTVYDSIYFLIYKSVNHNEDNENNKNFKELTDKIIHNNHLSLIIQIIHDFIVYTQKSISYNKVNEDLITFNLLNLKQNFDTFKQILLLNSQKYLYLEKQVLISKVKKSSKQQLVKKNLEKIYKQINETPNILKTYIYSQNNKKVIQYLKEKFNITDLCFLTKFISMLLNVNIFIQEKNNVYNRNKLKLDFTKTLINEDIIENISIPILE